jgi:hypothetical protein
MRILERGVGGKSDASLVLVLCRFHRLCSVQYDTRHFFYCTQRERKRRGHASLVTSYVIPPSERASTGIACRPLSFLLCIKRLCAFCLRACELQEVLSACLNACSSGLLPFFACKFRFVFLGDNSIDCHAQKGMVYILKIMSTCNQLCKRPHL